MFSGELKSLLIQVITSWQVLTVTGIIIAYIFLVRYVARLYHRGRPISFSSKKKEKAAGEEAKGVEPSDDDLGLEEKSEE